MKRNSVIAGAVAAGLFQSMATTATAGDAAAGAKLFEQECTACHTASPDDNGSSQGPSLIGVFNRRVASDATFSYTAALRNSRLTWDAATLDRFLQAPDAVVPGTEMVVAVPAKSDRENLIAYFQSLAGIDK